MSVKFELDRKQLTREDVNPKFYEKNVNFTFFRTSTKGLFYQKIYRSTNYLKKKKYIKLK